MRCFARRCLSMAGDAGVQLLGAASAQVGMVGPLSTIWMAAWTLVNPLPPVAVGYRHDCARYLAADPGDGGHPGPKPTSNRQAPRLEPGSRPGWRWPRAGAWPETTSLMCGPWIQVKGGGQLGQEIATHPSCGARLSSAFLLPWVNTSNRGCRRGSATGSPSVPRISRAWVCGVRQVGCQRMGVFRVGVVDDLNGRDTRLREGVEQFGHNGMPRVAGPTVQRTSSNLASGRHRLAMSMKAGSPCCQAACSRRHRPRLGQPRASKISAVVTRVLSRNGP